MECFAKILANRKLIRKLRNFDSVLLVDSLQVFFPGIQETGKERHGRGAIPKLALANFELKYLGCFFQGACKSSSPMPNSPHGESVASLCCLSSSPGRDSKVRAGTGYIASGSLVVDFRRGMSAAVFSLWFHTSPESAEPRVTGKKKALFPSCMRLRTIHALSKPTHIQPLWKQRSHKVGCEVGSIVRKCRMNPEDKVVLGDDDSGLSPSEVFVEAHGASLRINS